MRRIPFRAPVLVLLVAAFAAPAILAEDNPFQGQTFLTDYSLLKPVPTKNGQDYTYSVPGVDEKLARFDAIMVDQPEVSLSPSSPYGSAKPDDLKAISEFMRDAIIKGVERHGFKVVQERGERVLYMRVALTDLQLKKKKRGVLAYTPVGAVVHGVRSAIQDVMKNVDIIDMTGQAELSASQDGELIGSFACRRGRPSDAAAGQKPERMTFEEFSAHVDDYSDRMACRLENARRPPDQRIDCFDPTAAHAFERSTGKSK